VSSGQWPVISATVGDGRWIDDSRNGRGVIRLRWDLVMDANTGHRPPATLPGLDVLVLAGGPDAERAVSLKSGSEVSRALREAGHGVAEADAGPGGGAIGMGEVERWIDGHPSGVVFPAMHGPWGEGGGLQAELERLGVAFVGAGSEAARLCMDKAACKAAMRAAGVATPDWTVLGQGEPGRVVPAEKHDDGDTQGGAPGVALPWLDGGGCVVKPIDQGSSLGVTVCETAAEVEAAVATAFRLSGRVMIEARVVGEEVTVGVIDDGQGGVEALPVAGIRPAAGVYDYAAKYERDDTAFAVGEATGLSPATRDELDRLALKAHEATGCRHLSRADFMVDAAGVAWAIEVNTLPGMTDHSLLPMAARAAGLGMPALCDRLLRAAATG